MIGRVGLQAAPQNAVVIATDDSALRPGVAHLCSDGMIHIAITSKNHWKFPSGAAILAAQKGTGDDVALCLALAEIEGGGAAADGLGVRDSDLIEGALGAPVVPRSDLDQEGSDRSSRVERRRMRTALESTTWMAFSRLSIERLRLTVSDVRPR